MGWFYKPHVDDRKHSSLYFSPFLPWGTVFNHTVIPPAENVNVGPAPV